MDMNAFTRNAEEAAGANDRAKHPRAALIHRAAVVLLVVIAAANIIRMAFDADLEQPRLAIQAVLQARNTDEISREEQRYDLLRPVLQGLGVRGTIGYVTDVRSGEIYDDAERLRHYYLSQYALAPLVVSAVAGQSTYVIGDFENRGVDLKSFTDLEPLFDIGNGLVLFRRRMP
jgi:hypothetical protein